MNMADKPAELYPAAEPDYAVPPGETLLELLQERGMTQRELAQRTKLSPKHVNQLIQGVVPLSADVAERLEMVLGVPARLWNRLEADYRTTQQRLATLQNLSEYEEWLKELPVNELVKRGYLPKSLSLPGRSKSERIKQMLAFFVVASIDAWRDVCLPPANWSRSMAFEAKQGAIATWLRLGELAAREVQCERFSADRLRAALPELRELTVQEPQVFEPRIREICAKCGVVVVFVKEVAGCHAGGVARRLSTGRALIQLSLRYQRDDHFWFTFFHEIAHVLLHDKEEIWVEDRSQKAAMEAAARSPQEREADEFARDLLIPPRFVPRLPLLKGKSKNQVSALAKEIGVSPGIVVGRLQHDKIWPFTDGNGLKRKLGLQEDNLLRE